MLIFFCRYVNAFLPEQYAKMVQRIKKDAVLSYIRVIFFNIRKYIDYHTLRKTFGYQAWKQGVQPALLMSIYNHSSYEITKRYLGISQDERDQVFMSVVL